jgi:uncharacterized repeat protein (TIGR03803 family)
MTLVYSFCHNPHGQPDCADGWWPSAALVETSDGNFYGTTLYGGAHSEGTVFKITPDGTLTSLYSFCADTKDLCPDGKNPAAALVELPGGNFYGTASMGGDSPCDGGEGCGTVFKMALVQIAN